MVVSHSGSCCFLASRIPLVLAGFLSRSSYLITVYSLSPLHTPSLFLWLRRAKLIFVAYNRKSCLTQSLIFFHHRMRMVWGQQWLDSDGWKHPESGKYNLSVHNEYSTILVQKQVGRHAPLPFYIFPQAHYFLPSSFRVT